MSDKQNLQDLVKAFNTAKQEAANEVTKAEQDIRQARQEAEEQRNRQS